MQTPVPARKERNVTRDRLTHALIRFLVAFVTALPASVARALGRNAGWLVWRFDRRHRQRVLHNMDIAFRDQKTGIEKQDLCRRYFEHVGLSVVEFARMTLLTPENVTELCDMSELRQFDEVLTKKKGLLVVPAHHGNWELCGYCVSLMGYPLKSVARPFDNPLINDFILEQRQRSGHVILEKWGVLWKVKKLLDKGDLISMSVDQNGGAGGMFVPFFGSLASTVSSPADLHVVSGTPIIVATMNRKPDGIHHVFRVWDILQFDSNSAAKPESRAILTRINVAVERAIREYPEQWLWVHNRWKTRPPDEPPTRDGLPRLIGSKD